MTKSTLVIRHGAFGDLAKVVPFLWSLKEKNGNKTCLLTEAIYKDLILSLGVVNDVITDNRERFHLTKSFFQKASTLKQQINNFNEVIDLQSTSRTRLYKQFASQPAWKHIHKNGSPVVRKFKDMEEIVSSQDLLDERKECLRYLKEHVKYSGKLLSLKGLDRNKPYLVFILDVSKQHRNKSWPLQRFAELLKVCSHSNIQIICCAQEEVELKTPNVFNLTGQTSLTELVSILGYSALTIGGDTGPLHWAALFNRPTLSLFSNSSDVRRHAPVSSISYILQSDEVAEISVQQVFSEIQKIIPLETREH